MRAALLLSASLARLASAQWTLQMLSPSAYPMAVCLDGTQGGFYISPGRGADASNFLIHTQGGGCESPRLRAVLVASD
jgi:hypothetical protein